MIYLTRPRDHQFEAFDALYDLCYSALLMEQGTGKTKVAIDIASNLYVEKKINAVLLIAPNNVQSQWADEQIPLHSPVPYVTHVWTHKKSSLYRSDLRSFATGKADALKWLCVHVDAFSHDTYMDQFVWYVKNHDCMVIVDEATKIKNPMAKRSINIRHGLSAIKKDGKRIISITPLSKYRMILTGTVVTNSPFNAWSPFEFLSPGFFGRDFYAFKNRYGIEVRMQIPGRSQEVQRKITREEIRRVREYSSRGDTIETIARRMKITESSVQFLIDNPKVMIPYKNLDELKKMIEPYSFTALKKDCLDLPPKIYEKVYCELSKAQKKAYTELIADLESQYMGIELTVTIKLSLYTRLQQITGGFFPGKDEDGINKITHFEPNPKLSSMLDDLEETTDYPIIIIARFLSEIHAIEQSLKSAYDELTIESIYGEVNVDKRNEIRDRFNRGEVEFLVANAETIGMGFNLQICHTMYFYSNTYSFDNRAQVEDRIHRDGQQSTTVLYKDVICKNTIDERVIDVLLMKKDLLDYMRDKSPGEFLGRTNEKEEE